MYAPMRRSPRGRPPLVARVAVFAFAFTLCFAASAPADDWTRLCNSRDLSGWRQLGGQAKYHVEDGEIVGSYVAGTANSFLATERDFGDFVLEFEYKLTDGVNSGVQFRSESRPEYDNGRVHGYQYELETSSRQWSAGIYDEARRGWLYPVELNPSAKSLYKPDEWNAARIECIGNSLRTWLNGRPVAHLIDDATSRGFIALQVHGIGKDSPLAGATVRWRKLRIMVDPPAPSPDDEVFVRNLIPDHLSEAERRQGWRLLFDGKSSDAWSAVDGDAFPAPRWSVVDGALVVNAPGTPSDAAAADIVTREEFAAFELQLDFLPMVGSNSGIKYYVSEGGSIGLEYQILDDAKHPDAHAGVVGNRTCASLYDLIPSYRTVNGRDVPRNVNDWNHARIVAWPDGRVEHWLNDSKVLAYERGSNIYQALVARSKFKDIEGFGLAERGRILLQDHGDEVRFRSIKIRPLK